MLTSRLNKKIIIITAGDPRGIGPEVILKALYKFSYSRKATFLIIGDYKVFEKNARILKIDISSVRPQKYQNFSIKEKINFLDLNNVPPEKIHLAGGDRLAGKAAMEYVSRAVDIARSVKNSSLVTAPISKIAVNKAGYRFSGHTEFLSHAAKSKKVTMMLVGGRLRVSLVTRHIAFSEIARSISKDKIIETIENTDYALKKFFKFAHPRIGVASLNPHAGESALLGAEENSKIAPAVRHCRKKLKGVVGPLPSDTLFYKAYRKELDAVVCMYHDQGLIPLKMVAFDKGVNVTIGLPFIRTSPDHGTAFDIAGRGIANPSSMIEAIKLAVKLS